MDGFSLEPFSINIHKAVATITMPDQQCMMLYIMLVHDVRQQIRKNSIKLFLNFQTYFQRVQ
jgi:hypothetical protein